MRIIIIGLYILSLLYQAVSGDDRLNDMVVYERYSNKMLEGGATYYVIDVATVANDNVLLIMVRSFEPFSDPNLYISTIDENPSADRQEIACDSNGLDICAVPYQLIRGKSKLYIAVVCDKYCSYNLRSSYREQDPNEVFKLEFRRGQPKIVIFYIPSNTDLDNIDRIIIEAELLNPEDVRNGISMFVNKGNQVPDTQNYQFLGSQIWSSGLGIVLEKKNLCLNCNYTITITGWHRAMVSLKAESFGAIRQIGPYDYINDVIGSQGNRTYKFTYEEGFIFPNDTLVFYLVPYSGDPDMYVHPKDLPQKYLDFKWSSQALAREELIVTPQMIKEAGAQGTQTFYITITSVYYSSYSLSIYPVDSESNFISPGIPYKGSVSEGKIVNFKLFLSGTNFTVDLNLKNEIGNPDIFVQKCTDESACSINITEINQVYSGLKPQSLFTWSIVDSNKDYISFVHNSTGCGNGPYEDGTFHIGGEGPNSIVPEDYRFCTYILAVYGHAQTEQESKFTLLVNIQSTVTRLLEGQLINGAVELGDYNYYSMHLLDDCDNPKIKSVSFIVTSKYGHTKIYTSLINKYPNQTENDQASDDEPRVTYVKDNMAYKCLGKTYYISVNGISTASYTISTVVQRVSDQGSSSTTFLELFENTPQGFYLSPGENFYFTIRLPLTQGQLENQPDITISWWAWWSSFDLYITSNKKGDPSPTNFDYYSSSTTRNYLIRGSDQNFSKNGVFYAVVVPSNQNPGDALVNGRISYSQEGSIQNLFLGETSFVSLAPEERVHFQIEIRSDENIEITTKLSSLYSSDLVMYANVYNKTNLRPDQKYHEYRSEGSKGIKMTSDSLKFSCSDNMFFDSAPNANVNCFIYITLQSMAEKPITVNILVKASAQMLYVYDSSSIEVMSPLNGEENQNFWYNYYLTSAEIDSVTITLFSLYDSLNIYVNVYSEYHESLSDITKLPYPTQQSSHFSSQMYYSITFNSITISPEEIKDKCGASMNQGCIFLISVGLAKERDNTNLFNTTTFTLSVFGSSLVMLEPGSALWDFVPEKGFQYYQFEIFEPSTNIMISVTPLDDGDPDLMVSYGKNERPTGSNNSDWSSSYYQADMILIKPNSSSKIMDTMQGIYVVGVFGSRNSTFQLTYTTGNSIDFFQVFPNTPYDFDLNENGIIYLEYLHFSEEGFKILLNQDFGQAYLNVNTQLDSQDVLSRLPQNHTTSDWTNYNIGGGDYLKIHQQEALFRNYSTYIIGVKAMTQSKVQVLITKEDDYVLLQNNQVIKDFVENQESNRYHYFASSNFTVYLQVYSGSVDIYIGGGYNIQDREKAIEKKIGVSSVQGESQNVEFHLAADQQDENSYLYTQAFSIIIDGNQKIKNFASQKINIFFVPELGQYKSTKYSIQVVSEGENSSSRTLKFGVPVDGILDPREQVEYSFTNRGSGYLDSQISVIVNLMNIFTVPNFYKITPKITFKLRKEQNSTFDQIDPESSVQSSTTFLYRFTAQTGEFLIILSNTSPFTQNKDLEYRILVSDFSLGIITPNTEVLNLVKLNSIDQFEMFLPKNTQVLIEAFECSGSIHIQASKDYQQVVEGHYDIDIAQIEKNHLLSVIENPYTANPNDPEDQEAQYGVLYIGIQGSYIKQKDQNILYKVQTRVYPIGTEIPYKLYGSGNGGLLKWKRDADKKWLNVTFQSLECYGGDQCSQKRAQSMSPLLYTYRLIISTSEPRMIEGSRCQHYYNTTQDSQELYLENSLVKMPEHHVYGEETIFAIAEGSIEKFAKKQLFFTIVAKLVLNDEKNNQERLTYFYNPGVIDNYFNDPRQEESDVDIKQNNTSSWIISLAVLLLIGLIVALIIIFRKYKTIENQLNYEMQDVRAIAGQVGGDASREPGYQGFADV